MRTIEYNFTIYLHLNYVKHLKKTKKFLKVQQIRFHVGLKIIFITLTLPKSS